MTVLSDKWIKKMSNEEGMITPFEEKQIRGDSISYGLSSFGYDARVSNEFKIFTNVNSGVVDPKIFKKESFVTKKGKVLVGFREKMKGFITETKSCKTLRLPAGELLEPLAEMLMELSDPQSVPQIEVAIGDATMAFVIRHLGDFTDADLGILQKFSEGHQVQIYLQPSDPLN